MRWLRPTPRCRFRPGRAVLSALCDFNARIRRDFAFRAGVTTIATPVGQVLAQRAGVCQDFTHLMISGLRAHGLPARYVSGYIRTRPPPGAAPRRGADQSHAWVGAWLGARHGWIDLDPTNDLVVQDEHVVLALGARLRRREPGARRDPGRRQAHARGERGPPAGLTSASTCMPKSLNSLAAVPDFLPLPCSSFYMARSFRRSKPSRRTQAPFNCHAQHEQTDRVGIRQAHSRWAGFSPAGQSKAGAWCRVRFAEDKTYGICALLPCHVVQRMDDKQLFVQEALHAHYCCGASSAWTKAYKTSGIAMKT